MKEQKILDFLKTQRHMIIATANSEGTPEAAFVGFAEADDLSLIFGTSKESRKYRNVEKNNRVAIVFSSEVGITVQYEGNSSVLVGDELAAYKQLYFTKTPESKKYEGALHQVYLKITPLWLRYTDFTKETPEIFEWSPASAATTTESSS